MRYITEYNLIQGSGASSHFDVLSSRDARGGYAAQVSIAAVET